MEPTEITKIFFYDECPGTFLDAYMEVEGMGECDRDEASEHLDGDFWYDTNSLRVADSDELLAQFYCIEGVVFARKITYELDEREVSRLILDWVNSTNGWVRLGSVGGCFVTGDEPESRPKGGYFMYERSGYTTSIWHKPEPPENARGEEEPHMVNYRLVCQNGL